MKFIPLLVIALFSYAFGEDTLTRLSSIESIQIDEGREGRNTYTVVWNQDHLPEVVLVRFYKSEKKKEEIAAVSVSIFTDSVYKKSSNPEKTLDPFLDSPIGQRSTSLLLLDHSILDSTVIDLEDDKTGRRILSMQDLLNLYPSEKEANQSE